MREYSFCSLERDLPGCPLYRPCQLRVPSFEVVLFAWGNVYANCEWNTLLTIQKDTLDNWCTLV